jgi:hypothetical protein
MQVDVSEGTEKLPVLAAEKTEQEQPNSETQEKIQEADEKITEQEPPVEPEEEEPQMVMYQADRSWFDDALFIGDSRTVGLHDYGDLGNARMVAETGMSVYKIWEKEFEMPDGEKKTLEELLSEEQFGKIYLMLGINELGYSFETTAERYKELVEKIQEMQPEALIFLESNLHIGKEKSESSDVYNNTDIDQTNQMIASLADGKQRFYLDVNELFDDGEGNLDESYTADQVHIKAVYYKDWVDWILQHAEHLE